MTKSCINCGQPIPKKTHKVYIKPPVEYRPATTKVIMGRDMPDLSERQAKPEGHRDVGEFSTTIYTDNPPKTKDECQRFVNGQVVSVRRHWKDPATIDEFTYWDGESYQDRFFHNGACAQKFAYWAANRGVRKN